MAVQRLVDFLNQNHAYYSTIKHKAAYTSLTSAKAAHIPGKEMIKSLLLKLDGSYTLAVLPSEERVDFRKVKEITGSKTVYLAGEEDLEELFPDCSPGAIPPLGNLYHVPVITDSDVLKIEDLYFEPGSHREVMKMHLTDYLKLAHPRIAQIHRDY